MGNPESLWSCPVSLSLLTLWLYCLHLSALLLCVGSKHLCAQLSSHVFVPHVLVCLSHWPHLPLLSVCPAPCSICSPRFPLTLASSAFCSALCLSPPLFVCISLLVYCLNLLNSHSNIFTTFSALLLHVFLLPSPHSPFLPSSLLHLIPISPRIFCGWL